MPRIFQWIELGAVVIGYVTYALIMVAVLLVCITVYANIIRF